MSQERERVGWESAGGGAEELHVGGCWARVYRGDSVVRRDGACAPVLYWSAGVDGAGVILSGSAMRESKAKIRAIRALLLCQRLRSSVRSMPKEGEGT